MFAKKIFFWGLLFFFIVSLSFGGGFFAAQKMEVSKTAAVMGEFQADGRFDLSLFWNVFDNLRQKYFDQSKLVPANLVFGAIKGMVSSLGDPYTSFFDPTQNTSFKDELSGFYEGIGAQLGFKTIGSNGTEPQLAIVAPLGGSPAEKAGVKAGDLILKIDGKPTLGFSLAEAVSLIRGKEGTPIKLSIARLPAGSGTDDLSQASLLELTIKRSRIKVDSVTLDWKGQDATIAYIKISRFGDDTQKLWDQEVAKINSHCAKINCSLILDVRNNPGGILDVASYMLSDFFQDGVLVLREFPDGFKDKTEVNKAGRLLKERVIVLINGGSASSAEILAGALQDRDRAKLVGEVSFGKGTVQEAVDLDGGAALHVTSSKWLLPSGKWINGKGLDPDYLVPLTDEDFQKGNDPQLDKAMELVSNQK